MNKDTKIMVPGDLGSAGLGPDERGRITASFRRLDWRVRNGFLDGWIGLAEATHVIATAVGREWRERLSDAVERAALHAERESHANSEVETAEEALGAAKARPGPEAVPGGFAAGIWAVLYLSAAATILTGEVVFWLQTVAKVLELPTRGAGAWQGWAFAIGLTALIVPLEAALSRLVPVGPEDHWAKRAGLWTAMGASALLVLATYLLGGEARAAFLTYASQLQLLELSQVVEPFLLTRPGLGRALVVAITVSMAVAAAFCLTLGLERFSVMAKGTRSLIGRVARSLTVLKARRQLDRKKRRAGAAAEARCQAELARANVEQAQQAETDHQSELYRLGYTAAKAIRTSSPGSRGERKALAAYHEWLGLKAQRTADGTIRYSHEPPDVDEPLPIRESVRRDLRLVG